ncbi:unnamed protein product [Arctia plantaginis]|uniref:Uncharacterized protein n=1 Tax=Arctia plantaginis TaxID=874455 RepID=A0A8S0ZQR5_ARCPL|nr:unnamed protein product [Arctia plantaginis]
MSVDRSAQLGIQRVTVRSFEPAQHRPAPCRATGSIAGSRYSVVAPHTIICGVRGGERVTFLRSRYRHLQDVSVPLDEKRSLTVATSGHRSHYRSI